LNRSISLLFLAAVMMSGWAYSHAKMTSTVPADGDFVAAPETLVLTFDNLVQLTGVELKTVDGENRDLGTFSTETAKSFSINVPQPLPPGEYYVVWRSIAADSHFATGEFFFTVIPD
jgi:methionine-rich copper-binding protein CopC